MGLRAKFSLAVFAAFLIGFAIAAVVLQFVFVADARLQVVQNVRIMMSAADAVRHYMDQQVAPVLGVESIGRFMTVAVPFFAAVATFKDVQSRQRHAHAGTLMPAPAPALPAAIGRCRPLAVLGSGGMGTVYRAHDPLIDRTVAIKVVRTEALYSVARAEYPDRFRLEAQAAGRCFHPVITAVFDVLSEGGDPAIVMEFVAGRALAELIRAGPAARQSRDAEMLYQALACSLRTAADRSAFLRSPGGGTRLEPTFGGAPASSPHAGSDGDRCDRRRRLADGATAAKKLTHRYDSALVMFSLRTYVRS